MNNQVAVIVYDRHGMIDEIFLDSQENAEKRCLIHNLGYFLNSQSSDTDKELAATFESLIREEKWEKVFQLWNDENMDECEFSRPAHYYHFHKTPDMKDLWIYRKPSAVSEKETSNYLENMPNYYLLDPIVDLTKSKLKPPLKPTVPLLRNQRPQSKMTNMTTEEAYLHAKNVIKGRWIEGEDIIKTSPKYAYKYARDLIKGRWTEAEDIIKNDPCYAYCYAEEVIKGRWIEAEEIICQNPEWACFYAQFVIKGRWIEAEPIIKKDPTVRDNEGWSIISRYASEVIKGRWIEAEDIIKTDPICAYIYAKDVIKGRWIEAEGVIKTDAESAYIYAKDAIKGRWIEGEGIISTVQYYARQYAEKIVKDSDFWKKKEKIELINDPLKLINDKHNQLLLEKRKIIEKEKEKERKRIEAEKEKEREEQIRLQKIRNKHQNLNDWLAKIKPLVDEHNININGLIPNQENDFDEINVMENIVSVVAANIPMILEDLL